MKAWQDKMGKWAKGGIAAIKSNAFLLILMIANVILRTLDVFQFAIMKKRADMGSLAYMLFSGGARTLEGLENLLGDEAWVDVKAFAQQLFPDTVPVIMDAIQRLVLRVLSSYSRRIMEALHVPTGVRFY